MSNQTKRVTVGRKQGNTIVLSNPDVSGDHAALTLKDPDTNTWEIQDLGSRNGTFVDGQRILRKEVTPKNKVVFGNTPLVWEQVTGKPAQNKNPEDLKEVPKPHKAAAFQIEPLIEIKEPVEEIRLKMVYEDYISKRSQLEEIQRNEALNARYQSLGIPIAALFGGSAAFVPPDFRFISIIGSIISICIAGWSFQKSRLYATQKRELNITKMTEQYEINYRCPHCRVKLTDPFPVLIEIKNCRNCKKALIKDYINPHIMNPIDFEKTQIFADKAREMQSADSGQASFIPPASIPAAAPKPSVKKLTKEEKIMLATGGVLTLGLGTIVIANMNVDETPATTVVEPDKPSAELKTEAPVIETYDDKPDTKPVAEIKEHPAPVHKNTHTAPAPTPEEDSHSLIQVPSELQVSDKVTDDMSFDTAFHTARADVGPGGLFVWKDTYYGTFSESEWDDLSDSKQEGWLTASEIIMEPSVPENDLSTANEYMAIAQRGEITWTGIDKDQDGIAEVLIAHAKGTAPIVMMDTDADGQLDTRFGVDSATGQVTQSPLEKSTFNLADVHNIPQMDSGSVFANVAYDGNTDPKNLPVTILENQGSYIVGIDLDQDNIVDLISLNRDGEVPFVAMDMDHDDMVETGFLYNQEGNVTYSLAMDDPLQPMSVNEQEDSPEMLYSQSDDDVPEDDFDPDESDHRHAPVPEPEDLHAFSNPGTDDYHTDPADDFVG